MNVNVPSSSDFSQITSPINLTARSTGRRSHSEYKHIVQGTNQDFFESCISPVKIKGIWELKEKKAQEAQLDHPIEQEFKTSSIDIHVHKDALETIEALSNQDFASETFSVQAMLNEMNDTLSGLQKWRKQQEKDLLEFEEKLQEKEEISSTQLPSSMHTIVEVDVLDYAQKLKEKELSRLKETRAYAEQINATECRMNHSRLLSNHDHAKIKQVLAHPDKLVGSDDSMVDSENVEKIQNDILKLQMAQLQYDIDEKTIENPLNQSDEDDQEFISMSINLQSYHDEIDDILSRMDLISSTPHENATQVVDAEENTNESVR